jgi:hypothetical protein
LRCWPWLVVSDDGVGDNDVGAVETIMRIAASMLYRILVEP